MKNVVVLEYGFRSIDGVIYNKSMEPVSAKEYESIVKRIKSQAGSWSEIDVNDARDILSGSKVIKNQEVIVGFDHEEQLFVIRRNQMFGGAEKLMFKTIEPDELCFWLSKVTIDVLDTVVEWFKIDMNLANLFEGFRIAEFIFDDKIWRLVSAVDGDYCRIKLVGKLPTKNVKDDNLSNEINMLFS